MRAAPFLSAVLLCSATAAAQSVDVPYIIPHVGRLLTAGDQPANGTLRMKFTIHTSSGVDPEAVDKVKWTQVIDAVKVTGGFYSTELGKGEESPITDAVFDGGPRWLEVEVDGNKLSPRLRIGSAAFALAAKRSDSALKADDATKLNGKDAAYYSNAANLLGALGQGVSYEGAPIADAYVKGAAKWDAKLEALAVGAPLAGAGTTASPLTMGAASATADGYVKKEDFAGWLTKTDASTNYQPKGSYLTTADASTNYQPKGSYLSAGGNGTPADTGAVKLGNTTANCDASGKGVLRWSGTQFEGCDGTKWGPIAGSSGQNAPNAGSSGSNYSIPTLPNNGFARVNLTANTTITLPAGPTDANTAHRINVEVKQDTTGTRTVTWAAQSGDDIIWDAATQAPAAARGANLRTLYEFYKVAGDPTWRGRIVFRETKIVPGETVLRCTNNNQSFTVPDGVTQVSVKMWGAGGAGGSLSGDPRPLLVGGGGGYAAATLDVTSGEVLTVIVGCAGTAGSDQGGGGGGRSAIRRGNTELMTAGGGGGGSYDAWGGAGGGTNGQQGGNGYQYSTGCNGTGGGGGTQAAGGASGVTSCAVYGAGPTAGAQFDGGRGNGTFVGASGGFGGGGTGGNSNGGGGGGGGYFGGGGGFGHSGGGGGSSFVPSNGTNLAGSGQNPGNSGDPEREGAGTGGNAKANGQNAIVRIKWGS